MKPNVKKAIYNLQSNKTLLILLQLCGILQPKSASFSFWKSVSYSLYTVIGLTLHIPFLTLQILGFYKYWGNLQIITALMFQITVCIDGLMVLTYFNYRKEYLLHMFVKLDKGFLLHVRKVGTLEKQEVIMKEGRRISNLLTNILLSFLTVALAAWCILPFLVKNFTYNYTEDNNNNMTLPVHFEYYVIVMWIPDNSLDFPIYEIIYFFQFFYVLAAVTNFTTGNLIFSSVYFDISTQFRLLASAIEDVDNICACTESENPFEREGNILSNDLQEHEISNKNLSHGESFKKLRMTDSKINNRKPCLRDENIQGNEIYFGDRTTRDVAGRTITKFGNSYSETKYMIKCINYHQELLQFCKEVDKFLSPLLFLYIMIYEIMMCLPLYQLVLGQADDKYKFFTSAVCATCLPLTICFAGELLSQESMSVQKAAYGCKWYHSSECLKKYLQIIIMRTKDPVQMTAGKFFVASLETFADIGNKVFAYFTLLRNMQE